MKSLLIFPPVMPPSFFYLSVPLLVSQLQHNGFDVCGLDLNVEFYNDILNKEYIIKTKKMLENIVQNSNDISLEKLQIIKEYLADDENINSIIAHIDDAVMVLKTEKYFYNPKILEKASYIIKRALSFISLPFYPTIISYREIKYGFELNYKELKKYSSDNNNNIFFEYFEKKIDEKNYKNIDLIGISVPFTENIGPALTLARLLKEKTNAHITLGGPTFTHNKDSILKNPEIFDIFCDSIQIGEGECSIVELANYIKNKTNIENVSGLIYKGTEGNTIINPVKSITNLSDTAEISLSGINLKKYFTPEFVMPFIFSKGCYWGKCTFCDNQYAKQYCTKKPEQVVSEIQKLHEKYKIKYFIFFDDAIHPHFFEKLADEIIKRKLNIKYSSYARLEKDFSYKLLKKLYKSGLRHIFWGLESASERVSKLMNKGIDVNQAGRILKDSYNAGIWNHVAIIVGFPSESKEDFLETYNFCKKNKKYIGTHSINKFLLLKKSQVQAVDIEKELNIEITKVEEFSNIKKYNDVTLSQEEKNNRLVSLRNLLNKEDTDLVYLFKFGKKGVLNKRNKNI